MRVWERAVEKLTNLQHVRGRERGEASQRLVQTRKMETRRTPSSSNLIFIDSPPPVTLVTIIAPRLNLSEWEMSTTMERNKTTFQYVHTIYDFFSHQKSLRFIFILKRIYSLSFFFSRLPFAPFAPSVTHNFYGIMVRAAVLHVRMVIRDTRKWKFSHLSAWWWSKSEHKRKSTKENFIYFFDDSSTLNDMSMS